MTAFRPLLVLLTLIALAGTGCTTLVDSLPVNDAKEVTFPVPKKEKRTFTDPKALQRFAAQEEEFSDYRLGAGDKILLEVWDHPDLSGEHVLGPDGRVTLSLVGPTRLAGRTRLEAAQHIRDSYKQYYVELNVTVRVEEYISNQVLVLGRVTNPGSISFAAGPPTLLQAIALAGGLPVGGTGADKAALGQAAVFRGRERIAWINLQELLQGRNLALNIPLQRDDVVYIPDADDQLVYVLGQVESPGAQHLTPGMSFLDALARAGGPNEDADPDRLHVIRPSAGLNRQFRMHDLLEPNPQLNVALEVGDVIYVPASTISRVGYVFEQMGPVTSFFYLDLLKKSK